MPPNHTYCPLDCCLEPPKWQVSLWPLNGSRQVAKNSHKETIKADGWTIEKGVKGGKGRVRWHSGFAWSSLTSVLPNTNEVSLLNTFLGKLCTNSWSFKYFRFSKYLRCPNYSVLLVFNFPAGPINITAWHYMVSQLITNWQLALKTKGSKCKIQFIPGLFWYYLVLLILYFPCIASLVLPLHWQILIQKMLNTASFRSAVGKKVNMTR